MTFPPFATDPAAPRDGGGCLASLSLAALLITGLIILYTFFLDPARDIIQGMRYRAAPATIIESKVIDTKVDPNKIEKDKGSDPNLPVFKPEVRYSYRVDDKIYRSPRIWFAVTTATTKAKAKAIVDRYPEGSRQTAYVHPNKPEYAVLDRGFRPTLLLGLIPLAMVIIGGVGLLRRIARPRHHVPPAWGEAPPVPSTGKDLKPGQPITRRGKTGLGALIVVVLFGAIWNFAVSFLVREVLKAWSTGNPGCHGAFLTVFAIPFVAVGIGMIVAFFYCLLKLFNPRPIVAMSSGAIALGESMELAWRFTSRYDRIDRLRIILEGREEATYRRGTNTTTDREVFLSENLIDTTRWAEIRFGKTTITAPIGAVPSFDGQHNKILYVVRIIGDIRRWPDVNEEFVFRVVHAPPGQPALAEQQETQGGES